MSLFLPITKVDAVHRLVYGTISEEVPDKTGEILDYESAKPAFESWSEQFRLVSGGRSLGNVRAMHGSVAAGKLTGIHFDDARRRIDGVAKIVDDEEWNKVLEGVYTGFSIGGGYARRWPDPENPSLMRYTPVLSEVSLVDNPAVPTATFEMVRSDGSVELRKFAGADAPASSQEGLLAGLKQLAQHAKAIGARGLLAHIAAVANYLEEADESDALIPPGAKEETDALKMRIGELQKRVAELEALPLPAKGIVRARGEGAGRSFGQREDAAENPADRVHALMKAALANPMYF